MRIQPRPDRLSAPTTASQRRDWNSHHLRPDNSFLNVTVAYVLRGRVSSAAMTRAVHALVRRHEALRTRFMIRSGELVQVIAPEDSAPCPELTAVGQRVDSRPEDWLNTLASRPFDLRTDLPFRFGLLPLQHDDYMFALVMHHIICDNISFRVALEDLSAFVTAQAEDREPSLEDLRVQFADYAAWWRQQEQAGRFERSFSYWCDHLSGAAESAVLPAVPATSLTATEERWHIPMDVPALAACARRFRTTPYVVLLAMFSSALAKLTGEDDQILSCGTANRPNAVLRRSIGRFAGGIPLRMRTPADAALADIVMAAHDVAMNAYLHSVVSLDAVLERGLLGDCKSPTPFTNIDFQFVDSVNDSFSVPGMSAEPVSISQSATKRDLHVAVEHSTVQLILSITYRPSSLNPDWIHELTAEFFGRLARLSDEVGP